ncbi:MAG: DUF2306 domain-containing protein [Gammaproteobacteria bacterium]|nr:DUF2306 domain-containing protein [Gammaproteobacteria bacterium]
MQNLVIQIHLWTVIPAALLGLAMFINKKGSPMHKRLGKLWMLLMVVTAMASLLISAKVGPVLMQRFGLIHLLSIVTMIGAWLAITAARGGDIKRHQRIVTLMYVGGIGIAGSFAFAPGRLLHGWLFG